MKRLFLFLIWLSALSLFSSCSIYRSADRNDFETESPSFKIKSLQKMNCSNESLAEAASQSRFVITVNDTFLWEHQVNQISYYESNDLKGNYCLYDVTFE